MNEKIKMAITETLEILKYTNSEDVNKIPKEFINYLKDNASEDYKPKIDHSKPMNEMDILEETKDILGYIYRNWWCNENKKKIIEQKIIIEQEEEARRNYNPDDLFKNIKRNNDAKNT